MTVSTSDLCDAFPHDVHVLEPIFRCYGRRRSFAGRIATVRCFEDNSFVKEYSSKPGEGRVLVVDGGGSLRRALLGDQIAEALVRNGWVGIVVNGCVRDVEALNAMDLGIRALNSIPVKTERRGRGETDGQLRFAGVAIRAGQWLYADETGVLVADRQLGPE